MRSSVPAAIAAAAMLAAAPAAAQADPNAAPAPGDELRPGDVVVTARKQAERLLDVPVPVTAVTAATLTERSQPRLQDYFASFPGLNLSAQGNGQTNIAIRGITTGQTTNPAVGIVIDDIPFGSSSVLGYGSRLLPDLDPASLSRLEVLRGPQGTLYGASSIGGLLKFVTADPSTTETSGRVEAGVNGVAHGEAGFVGRASVTTPLAATVGLRAGGFVRRDGGYVDNVAGESNVNRVDSYGGLVSLLIRPSDAFRLKLSALLQDVRGFGSAEVDADYRSRPILGAYAQRRIPGVDDYRIKARLYAATIDYDLGPVTVTSLTGYGTTTYSGDLESTYRFGDLATAFLDKPGAVLVNRFRTRKFSQELRLASDDTGPLSWIVGGFYTKENTRADQQLLALSATGTAPGLLLDSNFPTTFEEYAGFGTLTVRFSRQFDVQLGGRYSHNRQTYRELDLGPLGGGYNLTQDSSDSKFTYLVTPRLKLGADAMIYARVASGYRPGGPNPLSTPDAQNTGAPTEFGPDSTTNYELGAKGSLAGGRVTYDLSAFLIDWRDIQLSLTNASTGFIYFINGPRARSTGVEGTVSLTLPSGLRASANAAYTDAKLRQNLPTGTGYGFEGNRLPFSARFTGSVSLDQDLRLTDQLVATLGGTATRVGRRLGEFGQTAANPRPIYPGYTSVDLRAGLRLDQWSLNLFALNVGDERGVVGISPLARRPSVTSVYGLNYIRPRTIGVSLAKTF